MQIDSVIIEIIPILKLKDIQPTWHPLIYQQFYTLDFNDFSFLSLTFKEIDYFFEEHWMTLFMKVDQHIQSSK